jgi:hypothetical protein
MNDVEAGKAHITTYVENSQFFKGLKAAESSLQGVWRSAHFDRLEDDRHRRCHRAHHR